MSDLVSQRERGKDRLDPPTRAQKMARRGHGGNNDRAIMLAEHGTDGRVLRDYLGENRIAS